jgi:hypothetical protein
MLENYGLNTSSLPVSGFMDLQLPGTRTRIFDTKMYYFKTLVLSAAIGSVSASLYGESPYNHSCVLGNFVQVHSNDNLF